MCEVLLLRPNPNPYPSPKPKPNPNPTLTLTRSYCCGCCRPPISSNWLPPYPARRLRLQPVHLRLQPVHPWLQPVHLWLQPVHLWLQPVHLWSQPLHLQLQPLSGPIIAAFSDLRLQPSLAYGCSLSDLRLQARSWSSAAARSYTSRWPCCMRAAAVPPPHSRRTCIAPLDPDHILTPTLSLTQTL